jgi:hypothetical protein
MDTAVVADTVIEFPPAPTIRFGANALLADRNSPV